MKFYIYYCFAEKKYQGNELLVIIADRPVDDWEQQAIAREINFSETTFILSDKQSDGGYPVRIWTPNSGEVPFAGHPTLGTAHVIQQLLAPGNPQEIKLNMKVGQITVSSSSHGMTMKQNPPSFGGILDNQEIASVYGIAPEDIRNDYPIQWVSTGLEAVIVPLVSRTALSKLKMDPIQFEKYTAHHPECYCNHLFFVDLGNQVFAARCLMEDFVEDPATGSANGDLAGYLLHHNYFGSRNISYTVYQGEDMGRQSVLHIHAEQNDDHWLIEVGGNCHIIASGDWE